MRERTEKDIPCYISGIEGKTLVPLDAAAGRGQTLHTVNSRRQNVRSESLGISSHDLFADASKSGLCLTDILPC